MHLLLKLICKFRAKFCVLINQRPSAFLHTSPAVKFVEQYQTNIFFSTPSCRILIFDTLILVDEGFWNILDLIKTSNISQKQRTNYETHLHLIDIHRGGKYFGKFSWNSDRKKVLFGEQRATKTFCKQMFLNEKIGWKSHKTFESIFDFGIWFPIFQRETEFAPVSENFLINWPAVSN